MNMDEKKAELLDEELDNVSGGVIDDQSGSFKCSPITGWDGKNNPGDNEPWFKRPH